MCCYKVRKLALTGLAVAYAFSGLALVGGKKVCVMKGKFIDRRVNGKAIFFR